MKRNSFTELLFNFNKMSTSMKLQRMQDFENMVARFQGRKPRTVTNKVSKSILLDLRKSGRDAVAFYNRNDPTKIYIVKLESGIDALKDIIHEGFHAYVDDFIRGKVNLKCYSKVDHAGFLFEQENLDKILESFLDNNLMELYDSFYIEERLNYQENALYLLKYIIDSIETQRDAAIMLEHVIAAMFYYNENESRGIEREQKLGISYEDAVENAIRNSTKKNIDISKTKKIIDQIDPELLKFFNQIYNSFLQLKTTNDNRMLSPEGKEIKNERNGKDFKEIYDTAISELLKTRNLSNKPN